MKPHPPDPRTPEDFRELPKFIIGDSGGEIDDARDFVVHLHYPRFVMEFVEGEGIPLWIDPPIYDPARGEPAAQAARLMREAGDFFAVEILRED